MFGKKNVDTLPKHWPYECTIDLVEGVQPPFKPIYNLSQDELIVLCQYINENLKKKFIWHSKPLASVSILFVKRKDGSFPICVDYCGLNQLTIKNQYPLFMVLVLLDQLSHAKVYTKIDLHGAYNLVHIWKGDECKTMFKTHYGPFEYDVMPFGLINAPIVFQHLMNNVFSWVLGWFCGLLQWHLHFLTKNGGLWMPCMFSFGKALRG
jgi:hypothetical protein